jgi:hypothetical protein
MPTDGRGRLPKGSGSDAALFAGRHFERSARSQHTFEAARPPVGWPRDATGCAPEELRASIGAPMDRHLIGAETGTLLADWRGGLGGVVGVLAAQAIGPGRGRRDWFRWNQGRSGTTGFAGARVGVSTTGFAGTRAGVGQPGTHLRRSRFRPGSRDRLRRSRSLTQDRPVRGPHESDQRRFGSSSSAGRSICRNRKKEVQTPAERVSSTSQSVAMSAVCWGTGC